MKNIFLIIMLQNILQILEKYYLNIKNKNLFSFEEYF